MRLFVAKLAISGYLLMLAYTHYTQTILHNSLQQAVEANVEQLDIHSSNKEFLKTYLLNVMLLALSTSILMLFSHNVLPKVVCALGVGLWSYFSIFPGAPVTRMLAVKIMEEICIIGGLLFIAGSEYVEASFVLPAENLAEKQ